MYLWFVGSFAGLLVCLWSFQEYGTTEATCVFGVGVLLVLSSLAGFAHTYRLRLIEDMTELIRNDPGQQSLRRTLAELERKTDLALDRLERAEQAAAADGKEAEVEP